MKYMLLNYEEETNYEPSPEEMEQILAKYYAYTKEMIDAGVYQAGEGLLPSAMATSIRKSGDEFVTTHGPYAELKEQLGGFYILECDTQEEAVAWAKKWPMASGIEVRPLMPQGEE